MVRNAKIRILACDDDFFCVFAEKYLEVFSVTSLSDI